MAHPYQDKMQGRAKAHAMCKAEGGVVDATGRFGKGLKAAPVGGGAGGTGNVSSIPFSVDKTADAMKRLDRAGQVTDKNQAADFAASRLKKGGYDPVDVIGREAKYKKGGRV